MSLDSLPPEIWDKILFYVLDPQYGDESGGMGIRFEPTFQQPRIILDSCTSLKGIVRQMEAERIYPLLFVSKQCFTKTMNYIWNGLALKLPSDQPIFGYQDIHFLHYATHDILINDPYKLHSNSLTFVRSYYVRQEVPRVRLIDQRDVTIDPYMLANPTYMPNLKTFSADLTLYDTLDVGMALVGATRYTEPLSIVLKTDYRRLDELAVSHASPVLGLITSLVYENLPLKKPSDVAFELRSITIINQMVNLAEIALLGRYHTQTYLDQIIPCKANLGVMDLCYFLWRTPTKGINVSPTVTELHCNSPVFESIMDQKLVLPNIRKLFIQNDSPRSWGTGFVQKTFTNLDEFSFDQIGVEEDEAMNLGLSILQSNPELKHFTTSYFNPKLWDNVKDKVSFPSVKRVEAIVTETTQDQSTILKSLFKVFPSSDIISVTTYAGTSVDYSDLKEFAQSNPKSSYIKVRQSHLSRSTTTPHGLISGFREDGFDVFDFCYTTYPFLPHVPTPRELINCPHYHFITVPLFIDLQVLREKIEQSTAKS